MNKVAVDPVRPAACLHTFLPAERARPSSRRRYVMVGRMLITAVWLYQGLWLKILQPSPEHLSIVRSIPHAGAAAFWLTPSIGLMETAIGVWVLAGLRANAAALTQTLLLIAMNAGGLLWNPAAIADPAFMIIRNLAFVALVWFTARGCHD